VKYKYDPESNPDRASIEHDANSFRYYLFPVGMYVILSLLCFHFAFKGGQSSNFWKPTDTLGGMISYAFFGGYIWSVQYLIRRVANFDLSPISFFQAFMHLVLAIFVSACVALYESVQRFLHPENLTHLWVLAAAGVIGFLGNELVARARLRAGRRLSSPALVADGKHARADGFVSLAVVASAALVALGFPRADPLVGLAITLVILRITWESWRIVSTTEPAELGDG